VTPSSPPPQGPSASSTTPACDSPYIRLSSLNVKSTPPPPIPADAYQKKEVSKRVATPGAISNSGSLSLPPANQPNYHVAFPQNAESQETRLCADEENSSARSNPFVVTVRQSPGRERIGLGSRSPGNFRGKSGPRLALYRSNSSLDLLDRDNYLLHHPHHNHLHQQRLKLADQIRNNDQGVSLINNRASIGEVTQHSHAHQEKVITGGCFPRRKDFGSHGSIDVLSVGSGGTGGYKPERSGSVGNAGNFLSLLGSRVTEDQQVIPSKVSKEETKKEQPGMEKSKSTLRESASPRLRLKLQKFWEHKDTGVASKEGPKPQVVHSVSSTVSSKEKEGLFRKFRGSSSNTASRNANVKSLPEGVKFEVLSLSEEGLDSTDTYGKVSLRHGANIASTERFRRRVLAHYDCQSVSANICDAAKLRGLLSKRRNTTTGASAASLAQRPHSIANNGLSVASNKCSNTCKDNNGNSNSGNNGQQPSSLVDTFSSSSSAPPDPDHGDDKSNALVLR